MIMATANSIVIFTSYYYRICDTYLLFTQEFMNVYARMVLYTKSIRMANFGLHYLYLLEYFPT